MRIHTGFEITYDCPAPVPMLLMLSVHPSRRGDLETFDGLRTDPVVDVHHYLDGYGNNCMRVLAPAGRFVLSSDFIVRDCIGRQWQLSTVQFDFTLPKRFELEYTAEDGKKHRPVMVHRALFGSVERFFGILIEHFGGELPVEELISDCLPLAKIRSGMDLALHPGPKSLKIVVQPQRWS